MIIDGHVHISEGSWSVNRQQQIHAEGVDAILCYTGSFRATEESMEVARNNNDFLANLRDSHPNIFLPFATVHPRFGQEAAQELARAIRERGMSGVAFNPQQQDFNVLADLGHSEVLGTLRELAVPILFDCDYLPRYASPAQLAEFSRRVPGSPIILGHFGWANMWPMAIEVAARMDNLFLETPSAPLLAIKNAVARLGAERVIFGSDFPCSEGTTVAYELEKVRGLQLPASGEEAILGGNLQRILKLPASAN